MADPSMYLHIYEDSEGQFFCLEQAPIPAHLDEARAAFMEQDSFWPDYRFTLRIAGPAVSYLNIAPEVEADRSAEDTDKMAASLPTDVSWRLQTAAARYRPPNGTWPGME